MRTKPSSHRHIDSRAKWTTAERINSLGPDVSHTHEVDLNSLTATDVSLLRQKLGLQSDPLPTAPRSLSITKGDRRLSLSWMD